MQAPAAFLRLLARFVFDAPGGPEDGTLVQNLPGRTAAVWDGWYRSTTAADRRAEILALARAPSAAIRGLAQRVTLETAAQRSPEYQGRLTAVLALVPQLVRNWLRRADDPRGTTITPALLPFRPEDIVPLIPQRLPLFKTGDRPFPEVERELGELLGVGPFGETWFAVDPLTSAVPPVVFKFCHDAAAAERLRSPDATPLYDLLSPGRMSGVVPLLQLYLGADPPCLGYEYVDGGDLALLTYHLHHHKAPADALHRVVRRVAATIGAFHRLTPPIVHGNLKASNVLLQRRDDGRVSPRVADFVIDPGQSADPRDDVFALGVLWYGMLVGDLSKPLPPAPVRRSRLLGQGVAAPVLELLNQCLDENPAGRLADAAVLAERIDALLRPPAPAAVAQPTAAESPGESQRTAEQWFVEGNRLLEQRKFGRAVRAFNAALAAGYDPAAVSRPRALANLQRHDYARAAEDLDQLVARRGTEVESYILRGEFFLTTGKIDDAIADFTRAHQIDGRSARVYIGRGRACLAKGEYDLALACFDRAMRHDPHGTEAVRYRGDAWLGKGEPERAFEEYTAALRLYPNNARLHLARGEACLRQDRADQALADFTEAIRLDWKLAAAHHARGQLFMRLGEFEDALMDLSQALRLDQRIAAAYRDRADVRMRLGKRRLAQRDYDRAVKRGRYEPESYLARARFRAGRGDHRQALVDFTKALALRPGSVEGRLGRGQTYLALKKYRRARADAREVLRREPTNAEARELMTRAKRAEKAE